MADTTSTTNPATPTQSAALCATADEVSVFGGHLMHWASALLLQKPMPQGLQGPLQGRCVLVGRDVIRSRRGHGVGRAFEAGAVTKPRLVLAGDTRFATLGLPSYLRVLNSKLWDALALH